MSVFKRKTSKGTTESYHYRFYHAGKIYFGVCRKIQTKQEKEDGIIKNAQTKQEALEYEKAERKKVEAGTIAIKGD